VKTLYFDSSYLFRVYSTEPGHQEVKRLLNTTGSISSAWHSRAEFATIFLRKRRERSCPDELLDALWAQFHRDCETDLVNLLPIDGAVMSRMEEVISSAPHDTFLRAADALHLACAAEHGFTEVYSNDRHFLTAASLFGLRGINIIPG